MLSKKLKNKTLLITGGTGSFGNAAISKLIYSPLREIRVFSRDEKKQEDMRKKYNSNKLKFYLGDIRDYDSLVDPVRGVDFIFHAAALKQVPSCEFYPIEAVKTNVVGTNNVLEAAISSEVSKVVCLSTDKAVYPINAMGTSKAMMEKVIVAKSRACPKKTSICITRYGNVMASRGSVIPLFLSQLKNSDPITVTDPEMTRFMMNLDEAINLVMYAFENGNNGDILVQKSPACSIKLLYETLLEIMNFENYPIKTIGTRHGEKKFEVLCSKEEMINAISKRNYFIIPKDKRDLNYDKYFISGQKKFELIEEYNSNNTNQLSKEDLVKKLRNLPDLKKILSEKQK